MGYTSTHGYPLESSHLSIGDGHYTPGNSKCFLLFECHRTHSKKKLGRSAKKDIYKGMAFGSNKLNVKFMHTQYYQ